MKGSAAPDSVPTITLTKDCYVRQDGSGISTYSAGYFYSSPVELNAGDVVSFTGYAGTSCAAIAKVANGTYTSVARGSGSTVLATYSYTADADCSIVFSGKISEQNAFTLNGETIEVIE